MVRSLSVSCQTESQLQRSKLITSGPVIYELLVAPPTVAMMSE